MVYVLWFLCAVLLLAVLYLLVLIIAALCVNKQAPNPRAFGFYRGLLVCTVRLLLFVLRVQVRVTGEPLPEGGFLLVGNHLSGFDPLAALAAFHTKNLVFVTKKENLDIPIGGRLILGSGCIRLDRSDDRQGLSAIRTVSERLTAGTAVGIYPEGTRSQTGELLPFRPGCFKAAQWARAPIAVVRTRGTEKVKGNLFRRPTKVMVEVKGVIPYEQIKGVSTREISDRVRQLLTEEAI
ncbi:MAG: 1-acyl-sn-glycerol-3-phosphate acyltransferase [Clostridia bacterium]|nr:1-acyl-sn-glycerol-3-phosphate acyltransferase [Clostridia bacterium]